MKTIKKFRIQKETEKAINITIKAHRMDQKGHLIEKEISVWMPKSQITIKKDSIEAQDWLVNQKETESGYYFAEATKEEERIVEKVSNDFYKMFKSK